MFRTTFTPHESDVHLSIPVDYIGKEVEVLLYSKDELRDSKKTDNMKDASRFKGLLTEEEALKYDSYLAKARDEWERDI